MFVHHINPVFLTLGPLKIHYYGLFFAISIVIGIFVVRYIARKQQLKKITDDIIIEFTTYLLIGSIIGARLIYVLFNDLSYYLQNPFEIIAVWHGGLAFYGAILGAIVAGYYYSKARKIEFYDLADLYVVPLAFGLFLGRIANFINGEAYGKIATVSWCVQFPSADGCRYPSQLFESAKNIFIFAILFFKSQRKHAKGQIFWSFFAWYGLLRFIIEFYRESSYYVLGLSMGQIASLFAFFLSLFMLYRINKKAKANKGAKETKEAKKQKK